MNESEASGNGRWFRPQKMAIQGLGAIPIIATVLISSYYAPESSFYFTVTAFAGFIGGLYVATIDANWRKPHTDSDTND